MKYLVEIRNKVLKVEKNLTGDMFLMMVQSNATNPFMTTNMDHYEQCMGSLPQYRGYPCSVWLLFHTLTVTQIFRGMLYIKSFKMRRNFTFFPLRSNNLFRCRKG